MSIITAGTTLTNGLILESNQNGNLVIKTGAAQTTALTIDSSQAVVLANALPVSSGGTGQTTYTNGQLLIGNTTGNTLTKATLTAGSGITITNGAGTITVASSSTGGAQDFIVQSYGIV